MLVHALHTLAVITLLEVVGTWCSYYSILQPFMSVCHLYMQISEEPNCARKLWKIDRTTESISVNVYLISVVNVTWQFQRQHQVILESCSQPRQRQMTAATLYCFSNHLQDRRFHVQLLSVALYQDQDHR